jgi:hypothetical protein
VYLQGCRDYGPREPSISHPLSRGWHGPRRVLVAHGADVATVAETRRVSYFDVVSTGPRLFGLSPSGGAHARSLVDGADRSAYGA